MRKFTFILISVGIFLTNPCLADNEALDKRILDSKMVFTEFNSSPMHTIPVNVLNEADSIIIFPQFDKGGFLISGRFGLGVALARQKDGAWGNPAFVRVSGGGFGLQAGYQAGELILVGRNGYSLDKFNGGPSVSGSASATMGPWGVHSEIGTGWELNSSMHWFSRNRGLFAALATDGTVFSYDENANSSYYPGLSVQEILFGNAETSVAAESLIDEITRYEGGKQKSSKKPHSKTSKNTAGIDTIPTKEKFKPSDPYMNPSAKKTPRTKSGSLKPKVNRSSKSSKQSFFQPGRS